MNKPPAFARDVISNLNGAFRRNPEIEHFDLYASAERFRAIRGICKRGPASGVAEEIHAQLVDVFVGERVSKQGGN